MVKSIIVFLLSILIIGIILFIFCIIRISSLCEKEEEKWEKEKRKK